MRHSGQERRLRYAVPHSPVLVLGLRCTSGDAHVLSMQFTCPWRSEASFEMNMKAWLLILILLACVLGYPSTQASLAMARIQVLKIR
jgi:hypothetical protein